MFQKALLIVTVPMGVMSELVSQILHLSPGICSVTICSLHTGHQVDTQSVYVTVYVDVRWLSARSHRTSSRDMIMLLCVLMSGRCR